MGQRRRSWSRRRGSEATWDFGRWLSVGRGWICTQLQGKLQLLLSLTRTWEEMIKLWSAQTFPQEIIIICLLAIHRNDYSHYGATESFNNWKKDNDCFVKFEQTDWLTDWPLGAVLSGGFSWVWFLSKVMATAVTDTWETMRHVQREKVLHFSLHSFGL